jgi:hypothetical protein
LAWLSSGPLPAKNQSVNFTLGSGRKIWFQGLGELIQPSEGNSSKILSLPEVTVKKDRALRTRAFAWCFTHLPKPKLPKNFNKLAI